MNAAHHLARQHVPGRDHELKGREGDTDGIGQMAPAGGAEAFRKAVLEIVEFDLDGRVRALSLQHSSLPSARSRAYSAPQSLLVMPALGAGIPSSLLTEDVDGRDQARP